VSDSESDGGGLLAKVKEMLGSQAGGEEGAGGQGLGGLLSKAQEMLAGQGSGHGTGEQGLGELPDKGPGMPGGNEGAESAD
jgi:hypothetical protein